jgi:hypothetical protein
MNSLSISAAVLRMCFFLLDIFSFAAALRTLTPGGGGGFEPDELAFLS